MYSKQTKKKSKNNYDVLKTNKKYVEKKKFIVFRYVQT